MAVAVVIMGFLSIMAVIVAMLAFGPVVNEIGSSLDPEGHWEGASESAIFARDQAFNAWLALPIMLIGALILWMFLAVTRRDYTDF